MFYNYAEFLYEGRIVGMKAAIIVEGHRVFFRIPDIQQGVAVDLDREVSSSITEKKLYRLTSNNNM